MQRPKDLVARLLRHEHLVLVDPEAGHLLLEAGLSHVAEESPWGCGCVVSSSHASHPVHVRSVHLVGLLGSCPVSSHSSRCQPRTSHPLHRICVEASKRIRRGRMEASSRRGWEHAVVSIGHVSPEQEVPGIGMMRGSQIAILVGGRGCWGRRGWGWCSLRPCRRGCCQGSGVDLRLSQVCLVAGAEFQSRSWWGRWRCSALHVGS